MDLFDQSCYDRKMPGGAHAPQSLEEYVGQEHTLGAGKLLRSYRGHLAISFYGPPGGQDHLGLRDFQTTKGVFHVSATTTGVAEMKNERSRSRSYGQRTIS